MFLMHFTCLSCGNYELVIEKFMPHLNEGNLKTLFFYGCGNQELLYTCPMLS